MSESLLPPRLNTHRVQKRSFDEMLGICKGIVADGVLNQTEAIFLQNWLQTHPELSETFPGEILVQRLAKHLSDGVLDAEETQDLLFLLGELTGEKGQQGKADLPTELAYNSPMPDLCFSGCTYVLTGIFESGERSYYTDLLSALGADVKKQPVKTSPCVVVVGALATTTWLHSTHGRKIENAVLYRSAGCPVAIVSETHLHEELRRQGLC